MQHYLVAMHQPTWSEGAGMINILQMVQKTFSAAELTEHIFSNAGGSSR